MDIPPPFLHRSSISPPPPSMPVYASSKRLSPLSKRKQKKRPSPRPSEYDVTTYSASSKPVDDAELAYERGMRKEVRTLYRENYFDPWEERSLDHEKLDAERTRNTKFAVVGRWEMDTENDSGQALYSFTIQSPILKKLLTEVFDGYKGVDTNTQMKELTFTKPFREFFFCWERYEKLFDEEKDCEEEEKEHIALLNNIIRPEITPHVDLAKEMEQQGIITFDYLWTLFCPGCEVSTKVERQDRIFRVPQTSYQRTMSGEVVFQLNAKFIAYDGAEFGWASEVFRLGAFQGYMQVKELKVIPLDRLEENFKTELVRKIEVRGKKFESLKGWHYRAYTGMVDPADEKIRKRKVSNGRVIIDADSYYSQDFEILPNLDPLQSSSAAFDKMITTDDLDDPIPRMSLPPPPPLGGSYRLFTPGARRSGRADKNDGRPQDDELKEEHYRFCDSRVRGYCLTTKQWVKLSVDGIADIHWNEATFKGLVLPSEYKDLILAFVDSHLSQDDEFDDVVQGKGKGIVILLSGVPGVGKTLTAEAVAEEMKKPLYSMSAGQLGFDADTVEYRLQSVLELCAKWRAVLLIDECDVFLEQRQLTDIHRNKLVAVFLRLLEYYQGCMFLTTNRVGSFDLAFKSRIDLIIDYPPLTPSAKKQIWQTFIRPSEEFPHNASSITEEQLDVLSRININGREIKNLVKTGRLLAKRKGEVLGLQHMRTVLGVQTGGPAIEDTEEVYPPLD